MNNLFEEYQHQRRLLPWLLVAVIWSASIWHLYDKGISQKQLVFEILILIVFPLIITLTLFLFKLSVKINEEFFMFKLFPFQLNYKKIKIDEISDVIIKEYNTNRPFHSWGLGISWGGKYKSYTVKGNKGVEILMKNGNEIFIGSGKVDEIYQLLKKLKN